MGPSLDHLDLLLFVNTIKMKGSAIILLALAVCAQAAIPVMKYDEKHCIDENGNPLNDKLFAIPGHCTHKFYQCSNGYRVTKTCPSKLVFNPVKNECDWWSSTPGCGAPVETTTTVADVAPAAASEDEEQAAINEDCVNENGDVISGLPYPVPGDCSSYYQCSNGYRYQLSCAEGLVFNPATIQCDWPYNVSGC